MLADGLEHGAARQAALLDGLVVKVVQNVLEKRKTSKFSKRLELMQGRDLKTKNLVTHFKTEPSKSSIMASEREASKSCRMSLICLQDTVTHNEGSFVVRKKGRGGFEVAQNVFKVVHFIWRPQQVRSF